MQTKTSEVMQTVCFISALDLEQVNKTEEKCLLKHTIVIVLKSADIPVEKNSICWLGRF